jgi:molybdenum cofactor biosynthesis protein B
MPQAHGSDDVLTIGFAAVTVSDSRRADDDESGALIRTLASAAGHRVAPPVREADAVEEIARAVRGLLAAAVVDVVVLTGGTGFSPRDVTIEALRPLLERELEGFGELFRALSYRQIGPRAMVSRALAGSAGGKAVFALPGSPKAVRLGMEELVLPVVSHLLGQLRRRHDGEAVTGA